MNRPIARPWALVLLLLLGLRYVHWRATETLNLVTPLATIISLIALVAELIVLASGSLNLVFSLWLPRRRAAAPEITVPAFNQVMPAVDVLVPTYGEPPALIEVCLRACLDLEHDPVSVWLLDDSGRHELEQLCQSLGCVT